MKTSIFAAAAALAFAATPALAQTAGQHQHHSGQHGAGHGDNHAQHGAGHGQHGADHSKHKDCCGDKNGNGKMDCCEGKEAMPCCAKHAADKKQAQPKS